MNYTVLENGNILVNLVDSAGLPMLIEMTPQKFFELYGVNP